MLEVVNSAFDGIAREIEEYAHALSNLSSSEIEGEDVNRLSLEKFLTEISTVHKLKIESKTIEEPILKELKRFGIHKVSDLSKLITDSFISEYRKLNLVTTGIGFLRDLMMYTDIDKYFARPVDWAATDKKSTELLIKKWGKDKVYGMFDRQGIFEHFDEDEMEEPDEDDLPGDKGTPF